MEIPLTVKELKDVLGAERCDKNGKLFFDCLESENHVGVLLHNHGAQFWIYYFRSGIGLVSLGDYFNERVNPTLVSPYSIYFESPQIKEPYKFVSGSLKRLKEVLAWTYFVCEGLKREKGSNGKISVSPHVTINCGNLKDVLTLEHSTETFINIVGGLAVKENSPYTVLREGFGRRGVGECYGWERKNKHRVFLNLEQDNKDVLVRRKIASRARLVNWLKEQGAAGERIIKVWNLGS